MRRFSRKLTRMGRPKVEKKFFYLTISNIAQSTTVLRSSLLATLARGTTSGTRIGQAITLKYIYVFMYIENNRSIGDNLPNDLMFRWTLLRYPKLFNPLTSPFDLSVDANPAYAPLLGYQHQYRVLQDRRVFTRAPVSIPVLGAIGPTIIGHPSKVHIWRFKKKINRYVRWLDADDTGLPIINDVVLYTCANTAAVASGPELRGWIKVVYEDA